jgi:hypothetical protein
LGDSEEDWAHAVAALEPYAITAVVAGFHNSLAICRTTACDHTSFPFPFLAP